MHWKLIPITGKMGLTPMLLQIVNENMFERFVSFIDPILGSHVGTQAYIHSLCSCFCYLINTEICWMKTDAGGVCCFGYILT